MQNENLLVGRKIRKFRNMRTQRDILFSYFKPEKSIASRRNKNDRSDSADPRWPPGRRRKSSEGNFCRARHFKGGLMVELNLLELFVFLIFVASSKAICPSKCICNDKVLKATCEFSNLEVVPIQLNPDIKHLKLNNNKIVSVHLTFIFYRNLIELDLSRNKIKSLGSKNFEFQVNLIKLNVSYNSIKNLHKDSFRGLSNLLELDLSGNQIEEINERLSFKDLHSLQELDLSKNSIYAIETGVFDYLIELKKVVLSENQLMKIPENALNTLGKLVEIDLNLNLIDELCFLSSFKSLEVLKLRSNLIGSLSNETFENLPKLRKLDLSDNNFTIISSFQFSKLGHLEVLNLSSNLFENLGPNSFRNLYKLREIYLDGSAALSKIHSKAFTDNINLNHVSLSNNPKLKRLPKFLLLDKSNLKHIRISGNAFSTLDASDLPLDQLETITLGRNPFICNCSLHWLWILQERQTSRNCSCSKPFCHGHCGHDPPEAKKLTEYRSEEDEYESSEPEEEEDAKGKNSKFRSLVHHKDVFPIILDLDEVYCESSKNSERILLTLAEKVNFDCTTTWIVILSGAVLSVLCIFLFATCIYVIVIRFKKKTKNTVENYINAAKNYENSHHTYYRYNGGVQNGDVLEVFKSEQGRSNFENKAIGMYFKAPIHHPYEYDLEPNVPSTTFQEKQFPSMDLHENSDVNIYQEPFAFSTNAKHRRPPHIVYV